MIYTLVVQVPEHYPQDDLIADVDQLLKLADDNAEVIFCGPGELVDSPKDQQV